MTKNVKVQAPPLFILGMSWDIPLTYLFPVKKGNNIKIASAERTTNTLLKIVLQVEIFFLFFIWVLSI